jgi:rhamnulokinase
MDRRVFAAVDIGASGGRVMAGPVREGRVGLRAVHRFANRAASRDGHLRWDVSELYDEVLAGLRLVAAEHPEVESIGIDTWGVDYGLLDGDGRLLAEPVAHRDDRTAAVIDEVHAEVPFDELYAVTGIQFLPFNTVYQLAAERHGRLWDRAAHVVLIPDLLAFWLTGELRTEITNASTTGLLDARSGTWSADLFARLGLDPARFPPLDEPGQVRGTVRPALCDDLGLSRSTVVTTVGSHDTASAVAAVPAVGRHFAYASSGTWSLVGVESEEPVLSAASRAANFTNERGVDGGIRYLRNVGGLWLLQESMRTWAEQGLRPVLGALLAEASGRPEGGPVFDVDDPALIAPGSMPERIAAAVETKGEEPPTSPAGVTRCIVDSLATAYATTVARASELTGQGVEVIHVVGGGSENVLLCQRTADLSGLPVTAGPTEATALGNVLVQARAHGAIGGSTDAIRHVVAASTELRHHEPRTTSEAAS